MFTLMLFVDHEMPSPTLGKSTTVKTTDVDDGDDENGVIADKLNMVVEKIEVVVDKAGFMPPDDEDDETSNNEPDIYYLIESSGMGSPSRDLEVTIEWEMFPARASYKDDDRGESDVMVCQGLWFDRSALEGGNIIS